MIYDSIKKILCTWGRSFTVNLTYGPDADGTKNFDILLPAKMFDEDTVENLASDFQRSARHAGQFFSTAIINRAGLDWVISVSSGYDV